ncbi:hypothetical protein [Microcella sp.]|uniref:hypothetical protein n=1 Tax=Microcella sp. TaxID=1913979 RepID=UPI003F72CC09
MVVAISGMRVWIEFTVPTDRVGGRLRFTPHDERGQPGEPRTVEVPFEGLRSVTETTMDILRPLSPRETSRAGTFAYRDADGRTGEVTLEGFRPIEAGEIQQAIRTVDISAAIGVSEPGRREVLSFGNSLVNRSTNPFTRAVFGVVCLTLSIWVLASALNDPDGGAGSIVAVVVAAALGGVSLTLIVSGARRVSWWMKARREARDRGADLPDALKFWN